ncbi:hypothetical protein INT46_006457 [Mucor plumbeus]|uniref:Tc1-like transposase DDE domain-containing protein n=1 Tax=Mucor plumbeus TaxID=97098 RepID=A0A8H7UTB6_9FUNG|nr:hypothetical protein INT46_006457 [Mucor plumbeus]
MSKTVQIAIKKLQDTKGSKSEIKKMKLSAIFYLTQLGFSQYDISNMIDMKRTTVEGAINRVATTGTTLAGKSMGRPSSFDDYTKRHLKRIIRSDPFQTIETLQGQLRSMSKDVSRTTVKNWIKKLGFKYQHVGWTDKQWEQVVWSDESRFRVFGHDGKPKVLRKQGERYESCHLLRTVKYGGGSLMVCSCFWAGGYGPLVFVDGNMNQDSYEDNAPCHTGGYASWWKNSHSLNVLKDWPAQSPDLNPIEHIWSELARQLRSRRPDIKNTEYLRQTLIEIWEELAPEFAKTLVSSMSKRCQGVIDAKGDATKY